MKYLLIIPFILTGCSGITGPIDANGLADAATDRIGAWVQVRKAETDVAVKVAETLIEEAKADRAASLTKPQVIMKIEDAQSMALYQLGEANKALAMANKLMGQVALAHITNKGKYEELINYSPMPEGAFAEGFRTFLGGTADVLRTPAAGILSGGYALKAVFDSVPKSGMTIEGNVDAKNSFNPSEITQMDSSESSITYTPLNTQSDEVFEPELFE